MSTQSPLSASPAPVGAEASSLGREIVAGLLGLGIAIGCVLPPLIHLVTGPLGPFIGGFVASNRASPGPRGRAVIASIVGTGFAGLIGIAAKVLVRLVGVSELPQWFPSNGTLLVIVGVVWVYGTAISAVGTVVSCSLANKSKSPTAEP